MDSFSLEVVKGNIALQDADLGINSANTYCIHGSGTALQFREEGGYLPINDKYYNDLVEKAKHPLDKVLNYINSVRPRPSKIQKECLEYIIEKNNSKPLELGDVLLTSSGDLAQKPNKAKYIANAIGMGYVWENQPKPDLIKATHNSVRNSLIKSFNLAMNKRCKSVAMPIMCTNKGVLSIRESLYASNEALLTLDMINTSIEKVSIVLHSKELMDMENEIKNFFNV